MKVKKRVGGLIIIGQLISSMPPCCRFYIAAGNIWWPCASSTCSSAFAMGQSTIRWPRLGHLLCRLANMTSEPVHPKQLWSNHLKPRKNINLELCSMLTRTHCPTTGLTERRLLSSRTDRLWFPTGNYSCPKVKAPQLFFVLNISFLRQIQRQIHLRVDLTADFAVDHDVQVFLRVSTDVSGNSMEADGGILQKETQPWTIKPWQTPTRNKACTLLFCDYHHGWTNLRFSVYILTQGICFSLQIRYHTLENKVLSSFY